MSILVIPEIRERQITELRSAEIQEGIMKLSNISVANVFNWSIFTKEKNRPSDTTLDRMMRGYVALSLFEDFLTFDVYIGFLTKGDIEEIDTIIYESLAAKDIFEARFRPGTLPESKEVIIIDGEMSIENEVYKRTVSDNIRTRK